MAGSGLIRLQKWLSDAGVSSRRTAEKMILDGRVSVNGVRVSTLGAKADTETDIVSVDGKPVDYFQDYVYIMLHKPEGAVTTMDDPEGRKTVKDLLNGVNVRVYPVGRLDYDSSGLLFLTNDGAWAQAIAHPSLGIKKKYAARIDGVPTTEETRAFENGLMIDGKRTSKCEFKMIKRERVLAGARDKDKGKRELISSLVHITISEGRNRQVRKMCEAIGHPVRSLKRIAVGSVKLGGLPRGQWRYLSPAEVKSFAMKRI